MSWDKLFMFMWVALVHQIVTNCSLMWLISIVQIGTWNYLRYISCYGNQSAISSVRLISAANLTAQIKLNILYIFLHVDSAILVQNEYTEFSCIDMYTKKKKKIFLKWYDWVINKSQMCLYDIFLTWNTEIV